jgi:aminopeptidase-like protein
MIGITKDKIQIGDWISRNDWIKQDKYFGKGNGYKVIDIDEENIYLLPSSGDGVISYKQQDGWILIKRDHSEYRRIVL